MVKAITGRASPTKHALTFICDGRFVIVYSVPEAVWVNLYILMLILLLIIIISYVMHISIIYQWCAVLLQHMSCYC